MNIDEIRIIEKEMVRILPIFLREFVDYVAYDTRNYILDRIKQNRANHLIGFDSGMGAWCRDRKIYFAIQNKNMFVKFAKNPEYGQKKSGELITSDEFIDNDKDYIDYMQYIFDNGLTELDYCLDLLPHQVTHLIGCKGGVLGEGITELRTRQICKMHGIRCAPILHSKETKIIRMLDEFVDDITINESAFLGRFDFLIEELEKKFGKENFQSIYEDLCIDYRTYASDRSQDPFVHYQKYREIDFSRMFDLIESIKAIEINETNEIKEENEGNETKIANDVNKENKIDL